MANKAVTSRSYSVYHFCKVKLSGIGKALLTSSPSEESREELIVSFRRLVSPRFVLV